jgi:hypothetical protein
MSKPNDPIPHLLVVLMEEAAEVQKECAKALRFGLRTTWDGKSPETRLKTELNDLSAVWDMLLMAGVDIPHDDEMVADKVRRLDKAAHDTRETGMIKP